MGIISEVGSILGGTLVSEIRKTVEDYLPPEMSPADKANLELKLQALADARAAQVDTAFQAQQTEFDQRIKDYEGTASDLKSVPYLGALMLFLRGSFRPLFSYGTAYVDLKVFSGAWTLTDADLKSTFWIVNVLVLGFFFGERALQNILPLLKQFQLGGKS